MAQKQTRLTDELNVELSRISSSISIAVRILGEMPASEQNRQLMELMTEARKGHKRAAEIGNSISKAASQI